MALDINATWLRSSGARSYKVGVRVDSGAWTEYIVTDNSFNLGGFSLNDFVEARVRAVNNAGQSEWTDTDSVTILGALPTPLSGLTATGILTGIRLDWDDNAINETGYRIYRSVGGGGTPDTWTWTLIHTTAANIETYEDVLAHGETRYYIVVGFSPRGVNPTLDNSYTSYVTTMAGTLPNAPSALSATAVSTTQIDLAWTDNSTNETGFKIERSANGVDGWVEIDTVLAGVVVYEDTGLTAATQYYYRVRAYNAVGNSLYAPVADDTTDAVADAPSTPTGLAVSEVPTRKVYASWNSVATATSYTTRYSVNGGLWSPKELPSASTNWTSDISFSLVDYVEVQVLASNVAGDSVWSSSVGVTIGGGGGA